MSEPSRQALVAQRTERQRAAVIAAKDAEIARLRELLAEVRSKFEMTEALGGAIDAALKGDCSEEEGEPVHDGPRANLRTPWIAPK